MAPALRKNTLRRQALAWLRTDLESRELRLQKEQASAVALHEELQHWQRDDDLASVRDDRALAAMPGLERADWRKLWVEVYALLKQARGSFVESRLHGTLNDGKRERSHAVNVTGGKSYVIDMHSKHFDTFLRLEDAGSKELAENDDISKDNLNSRITFTPQQDGVYRLIATSYQQRGRGDYEIIIREFTAAKR